MSAVSLTRSYSLPLSGLSLPPSKVDKKDDRADRFSDFCIEQGMERGLAYLKEQWRQGQHPFPSSFETLVSNPNYLSAWSTAHAFTAGGQAITDVEDRECLSMAFSTGATLLGVLDGLTSRAGLQRYQYAQEALKSSLTDLAQALTNKDLDALGLATIKGRCAKNIQTAMGLTGMRELITQILADGVMAIHSAVNKAADMALLDQIRGGADDVSHMCEDPVVANQFLEARKLGHLEELLYPKGREFPPVIPQLKSGVTSEQFLKQVKVQEDNFGEQGSWLKENTLFGVCINAVSFFRGLCEVVRFKDTRGFLREKRDAIARAIHNLQSLPGMKVLTHLFHATCFRIKSNSAALVGAVARIVNAIGGILIKGLVLGGVAVGPAGTVLSAVIVGIYALKAYAQRHYDRLAGRNENEVANALKMAANVSPEELGGAIAQDLMQDLQALAGNIDNVKAFLEAMDHPELFDDFKARFEKAANDKEKLALLKTLLDACMPKTEGTLKKCLMASLDGRHQLIGHLMLDAPVANKTRTPYPKAMPKSGNATWEEKLFRNLPDKAIASLLGEYPGLHMRMGYSKQLSIEAEKHLARVFGDTPATRQLIAMSHALGANEALVKNRPFFHVFVKSRTWELSPHGKDIQQALECGNLQTLKGMTLAAALSQGDHALNNHHLIAGCRFDETTHAKDYAHLVAQLKTVCTEKSHAQLKTMVEAMETCKGKPLLDLARKMQRTQAGKEQFQRLFETACMLITPPRSAQKAASTYAVLFEGRNLATLAGDDLSHTLAVVTRQQLHARIGDTALRDDLRGFLEEEGSSITASGDMLFLKTSGSDSRWDLYANEVIAGKCRLEHAPDWLLHNEFKTLLKDRKLGKDCQAALREQFQIGLSPAPDALKPFSLLWPPTILGKNTAVLQGLWQYSFAPLAGIDARNRTWRELKAAAVLYGRCHKGVFGLSDLEKLIKSHKKDSTPEQRLTIQFGLQWISTPWSLRIADQNTVKALMTTKNSKAFVKVLKDKVNPPPTREAKLDASLDDVAVGNSADDTRAVEMRKRDLLIQKLSLHFKEPLSPLPEAPVAIETEVQIKQKDPQPKRRNSHVPSYTQKNLLASSNVISMAQMRPQLPSHVPGDAPLEDPDTRRHEPTHRLNPFDEQLTQHRLLRRVATA